MGQNIITATVPPPGLQSPGDPTDCIPPVFGKPLHLHCSLGCEHSRMQSRNFPLGSQDWTLKTWIKQGPQYLKKPPSAGAGHSPQLPHHHPRRGGSPLPGVCKSRTQRGRLKCCQNGESCSPPRFLFHSPAPVYPKVMEVTVQKAHLWRAEMIAVGICLGGGRVGLPLSEDSQGLGVKAVWASSGPQTLQKVASLKLPCQGPCSQGHC